MWLCVCVTVCVVVCLCNCLCGCVVFHVVDRAVVCFFVVFLGFVFLCLYI